MVTDFRLARARSSSTIRASTGGASGTLVMCSSVNTSAKPSNPSMITNRAPDIAQLPSTAFRPKTWKSGSIASTTLSLSMILKDAMLCRWLSSAMAEHRGLRLAGGAGCIEQDGQGFGSLGELTGSGPTLDNSASPSG